MTVQMMALLYRFIIANFLFLTLMQLPQGHVQVSFLDNSPPKVVDENKLVVLDRSLHIGDVVKRRPEDMMSGIVSNARMNMFLQHTFTGQTIQNVDSRHVKFAVDYAESILPCSHI